MTHLSGRHFIAITKSYFPMCWLLRTSTCIGLGRTGMSLTRAIIIQVSGSLGKKTIGVERYHAHTQMPDLHLI
ncbi:hypothetical protein ES703_101024 [subsurface metagenome]